MFHIFLLQLLNVEATLVVLRQLLWTIPFQLLIKDSRLSRNA